MSTAEDKKIDTSAIARELANDILVAAGSGGLRFYMPYSQDKILKIAEHWVAKMADARPPS